MKKESTWEPRPGWLMLVPVKLPEKTEGGLFLPESFTTKSNSGVCVKCGNSIDKELFWGQECFFPQHDEYQIIDSDNGQLYYVVEANHIILVRKPAPDSIAFRVSQPAAASVTTGPSIQRNK